MTTNDNMKDLEIIRTVGNYSLVKKGRYYYIDNGIDDVSEYMDRYDASDYFNSIDEIFIKLCERLFQ